MRLTCPNCGAQYEVPDDVIPEAGRDVQCSNCGDTWFQERAGSALAPGDDSDDARTDLTEDRDDAPEAEVEAATPPPAALAPARRELDPAVADVLREEALRETRARAAEAGALETQPELGLSQGDGDAARRSREARERVARLRGTSPEDTVPPAAAHPEVEAGARRTLLPDIEEINSSLRANRDDEDDPADRYDPYPETPPARGGGFRLGFLLVVLLAVILLLLYVFAPMIAARVPVTADVMADYVGYVDGVRAELDALIGGAVPDGGAGD